MMIYVCYMYTVNVQDLQVPAVKTMIVVPMTCAAALVHLSVYINCWKDRILTCCICICWPWNLVTVLTYCKLQML